jgi:hypothetical protein
MGKLRQSHAAGVATYEQIYFFIGRELFDSTDACLWVFGFVGSDELKFASKHAAFFVDVVDCHLDGC